MAMLTSPLAVDGTLIKAPSRPFYRTKRGIVIIIMAFVVIVAIVVGVGVGVSQGVRNAPMATASTAGTTVAVTASVDQGPIPSSLTTSKFPGGPTASTTSTTSTTSPRPIPP